MIPRLIDRFSLSDDGWIRAFPVGEFKRDGRAIKLTPDRIKRIASNFKSGRPRYRPNINVEHKDGAVGWIEDMEARGDGLYVKPDAKAAGFLASGQFRYVSPEIVWEGWEDAETGDRYDDVMVGLAATNHPFFGEDVALFSAREDFQMPSMARVEKNDDLYGMMNLMQTLGNACDEHGEDPDMGQALTAARDAVKRKMGRLVGEYSEGKKMSGKDEFGGSNAGLIETIGLWDKTLRAIRKYLPAEQAEEVEEAVDEAKEEAKKDAKTDAKTDKTDKASGARGEVLNVTMNGVDPERFTVLETENRQLKDRLSALETQNQTLAQAVSAQTYRAQLAEMERFCEQFGSLGTGPDFAKQMLAYRQKLGDEEFNALVATLRAANTAAASSDLFARRSAAAGVERSALDQFNAKVKAYQAEHKATYADAFTAVGTAEPDLYAQVMGR